MFSEFIMTTINKGKNIVETQNKKSFEISQLEVHKAYLMVKRNKGAAGVDEESIEMFEQELHKNLYKIWNRMSSGTYFPPAVKRVLIPKKDGGKRPLGIPTVADRIAQTVVKEKLEETLDREFHPDSYGYRPGKSALEAVEATRQRCWKTDWVLDVDIQGFFDNIDHNLLMKAVEHVTEHKWIILYIKRWLKAPVEENGEIKDRDKGTPQGGVVSPLLANLFLHYVFDKWMEREFPTIKFARYADDIVIHGVSEKQTRYIWERIRQRFEECGLTLHPEKTKIVYCKDGERKEKRKNTSFDFLGFTFQIRTCKNREGKLFNGVNPGISKTSQKAIYQKIRNWEILRRIDLPIQEIARKINPAIRGWINYYGRYMSYMGKVLLHIDKQLYKWVYRKYKSSRKRRRKAMEYLKRLTKQQINLFAHWKILYPNQERKLVNDGSRMN